MDLLPGIIGLLAVFVILLPLFVWFTVGEDAAPRFDVFDPARHAAPHEVTAFIHENLAPLIAEGFKLVGDMIRERGTLTTRVAILQHADGVVGTVVVVSTSQGNAAPMVEFTAELSGGRVFDVNNTGTPPTFAVRPGHDTYRLPQVRDPLRLYRVFQVLLRRRFGSATLHQREIAADPARFLAQLYDEAHHWQVEAGYYRFDRKANRYRPTLKGAYLMSWGMLPPFGQLRRAAVRRKAGALLRQIGMEGEDQRPVAAPASVTHVEPPPPLVPRQRGTDWPGILLGVGFVLLLGAVVAIGRFVSGFASLVVFLGGLLLLLWLSERRHGRGRIVAPFGVFAGIVVGVMGFREYQARRPIDRENLSVPADFPGAVAALAHLARTPARPLVVRTVNGQLDTTSGFYVAVRAPRALAVLDSAIRKQFREQGFYLFWWIRRRGVRGGLDRVGLYPSADQYAVVRAMQTGGPNVGPDSIVAWFEALERDYRFKFVTIGPNNIEGRLAVDSASALEVARRFSEFCPDLERSGAVTTEQRATALLSHDGYFQCWWEPRGRSAR